MILRCKECGCLWRRWEDSTVSLADAEQNPGPCCDNATDPQVEPVPIVDAGAEGGLP